MKKPDWNIGDQWTYAVKYAGDELSITREIIREDTFEGNVSYVMRSEGRDLFYSKQTLERLAAIRDGKLTNKRYSPSRYFSWPLTLGKRWGNIYTSDDLLNNEKEFTNLSMRVAAIEEVTVPAGTFLSARIQGYDAYTGRLMREAWYAPVIRWLVKSRDYSEVAFEEEELTSFKLN